ncbi:MAG TPA: chromate transporter [bacterium]|nr:chromate transporter [bacterium]
MAFRERLPAFRLFEVRFGGPPALVVRPAIVGRHRHGQLTPGPVSTTASFIGYLLAGGPGALAATLGIFLPAFLLVALSGWLVPKIRSSPRARAFLEGVTAGSLGLMAWVGFQLGKMALVDWLTFFLFLLGLYLVSNRRVHPAWIMAGGALAGYVSLIIK